MFLRLPIDRSYYLPIMIEISQIKPLKKNCSFICFNKQRLTKFLNQKKQNDSFFQMKKKFNKIELKETSTKTYYEHELTIDLHCLLFLEEG